MDMSENLKDVELKEQAVRFCRGIIRVAQFELALKNYEQLEEAIKVAEAREAELAKELGRYRYGDKFDEREMSIFSREFSPAKQSVAEFKFTLNEFECIAREIKESEEKDKREILEEDLKKETERYSIDKKETYNEMIKTTSKDVSTEVADTSGVKSEDKDACITPPAETDGTSAIETTECNEAIKTALDDDNEAAERTNLKTIEDQDALIRSQGLMIPKRRGQIIAVNPFITRNFISFKYRETIQPSLSQKLNEQIGKGEKTKTKKETKLEKKRVKESETIFKKYLKVANRRMEKYKKESRKQLEKEEKETKKKLRKEQMERARLERKETKDRKKLEKEMKKKGETKEKNDSINMPVVIDHMNITMKESDVDFKDDGKGNLNNEEKKNIIGKRIEDFFRSLICAKK
ncbi:DNA ligase 1-like [Mytilus trossulus]|uniref:DNA ligase 1-like n=1 Tax=Mytilus trossulus TaxID=6551 RepID=UPI003004E81A